MDLTMEQKDIIRAAREFAEKEFRDRAKEFDEAEEFDLSIVRRAAENGFIGVFIKEEYGGAGLGFLEHSLITEELWRVDPGCGQNICSAGFGSEMIQAFGTEEQKRYYLPKIISGEAIIGTAITEPDAGSDVTGIKTRAEKKGDHYVLNGSKMFITNGCNAKYLLIYAVTNPETKDV
ncbi:MAG: acyl-CoA dehydrogenase family protein, partial [Syntrophorhabdus sp.]